MTASIKIRQLESRISDLQNQHQLLLKERQQEIAVLLSAIDLAHLDDKTLLGGLLYLKDKITTQDPMVEAWHAAGEKFLRYTRPKRYSQVPEKNIPPKQTTAAHTRDQSPQKQPQPREE